MSQSAGPNSAHYDHFGYLAFLFSLATVIAFFIYMVIIYPGVNLQENIQDLQAAPKEMPAAEKVDLSQISEPWKPNPNLVIHGKAIYAQQCAMCHGVEGKGDGPAGAGLNPKPRNLVTGPWKLGGGYIGLFKVITDGIVGSSMASYKHLSVVDRWALVQFIDSITQMKVSVSNSELEAFAKTAK